QNDAVEGVALGQEEVLQPRLQRLAPAPQLGQFLLGVELHLRVRLGGRQRLGLGQVEQHLFIFEIGFDLPGQRAVFLGGFGAAASAAGWSAAPATLLRLAQLYLRWNLSTRPVVSTNFILPVKNGWQAEQISTVMFLRVLRVGILLPQPQVMTTSS